jgi:hypothetical protein
MLNITIAPMELFDEKTQTFMMTKQYELRLEHSLVSLSKWESKWQKPFLTKGDKSREETIDYVRCMTITQNVDPLAYIYLSQDNIDTIAEYISSPMTATIISQEKKKGNSEIITAEIVYYWMISFNIPFECQTWHLNRLLTLINVCSIRNQPAKKMTRKEYVAKQKALNDARRAKYNTKG